MKILHVNLAAFYIDNYAYQENLLPKYHKKMGYEVEILASLDSFNTKGEKVVLKNQETYFNEEGIKVIRIPYKFDSIIGKKLKVFPSIKGILKESDPDFIFIHGCQFYNVKDITDFCKNRKIRVFVDNHADFSNSARNWSSKNVLHKLFWRRSAKILNSVTETFFGVLPARVDFLRNMYGLPSKKCKLLIMGGDDDFIDKYDYAEARKKIVEKFPVELDDFLIITAGKIDEAKIETFNLIEAVKRIDNPKIKLIIFGTVTSDLEQRFYSEIDGETIIYGGWMENRDSYINFKGSDLAVFPGRHSVYWEQVASVGKPLIVKEWPGTKHVNINGNVWFLTENTVQELENLVDKLYNEPKLYNRMLLNAEIAADEFRYSSIAYKSLNS